jgi:dipeptidyl aminopeptidase/acylaminoacyl peptidase
MHASMGRAGAVMALACIGILAIAPARAARDAAPPAWAPYLERDAIEDIQISPSGRYLALAEHDANGTIVTIRDRATLEVQMTIDPGSQGEVSTLEWLGDDRLLVGANRLNEMYQVSLADPVMYIVDRVAKTKYNLPANFVSTIDGDRDHLLVSVCHWDGGCVPRVHRVAIGHSANLGDPIISAPEADARLWADQQANVRFAVAWDDESNGKLWVHRDGAEPWTLVNDGKVSGTDSVPLGLDQDGKSAFLFTEHKEGPGAIERYDIASGTRTEIYRDAASDALWPIYAFDGNVPIGAYYDATAPRVVIWNPSHPDAAARLQIINAFPGKLVSVASTSADHNLVIVVVADDTDPGAYYLFDRAAHKATLIARKRPWLASLPQPRTRPVAFAARDGLQLHGLLTLPVDAGDAPLPMVVLPHGGPYGILEKWGYDAEASLLASRGYAVLRVNFRGSGGYGRAFEERGYRQWGAAMQDDLTDATHWAIDRHIADASRICIYGASYGGYAALMGAVREPSLYRCAASYAGPTELAKMYKWGSIRRSDLGINYLHRVLGTDATELAQRSPAERADAIGIPVLLGHGELDARVDENHTELMAKRLRKRGVKPEYVEYPKEGHGLLVKEDELDFYRRLLSFLDRNIGAAGVASNDGAAASGRGAGSGSGSGH